MTLRYDKDSALRLTRDIDGYTDDVTKTINHLHRATSNTPDWRDKKYHEFNRMILSVFKDVSSSVHTLTAYKEHLEQKIRELE